MLQNTVTSNSVMDLQSISRIKEKDRLWKPTLFVYLHTDCINKPSINKDDTLCITDSPRLTLIESTIMIVSCDELSHDLAQFCDLLCSCY